MDWEDLRSTLLRYETLAWRATVCTGMYIMCVWGIVAWILDIHVYGRVEIWLELRGVLAQDILIVTIEKKKQKQK